MLLSGRKRIPNTRCHEGLVHYVLSVVPLANTLYTDMLLLYAMLLICILIVDRLVFYISPTNVAIVYTLKFDEQAINREPISDRQKYVLVFECPRGCYIYT